MNLFHLINIITAYSPNKYSKLLKQRTKETHDQIEQHPFFRDLLNGTLPDVKYAYYLANILPIYELVEKEFLGNVKDKSVLQSVKIKKDLDSYSKLLNRKIDNSTYNYAFAWVMYFQQKNRIYKKAELYVRWLADMYGGQVLKKKVKFGDKYKFSNLRSNIQFIRKMIEEDLNDDTIDKFIEEVNIVYKLHNFTISHIYQYVE